MKAYRVWTETSEKETRWLTPAQAAELRNDGYYVVEA